MQGRNSTVAVAAAAQRREEGVTSKHTRYFAMLISQTSSSVMMAFGSSHTLIRSSASLLHLASVTSGSTKGCGGGQQSTLLVSLPATDGTT